MADRTITIRIVSQQNSAPSANAESNGSDLSIPSISTNFGEGSGNESGVGAKVAAAMAAYYLTKQSISVIKSAVDFGIGRCIELTEDYKGQQSVENTKARINELSNIASSSISGAQIGNSIGGPIGALIGMIGGIGFGAARAEEQRLITLTNQEKQIHEEAFALYFNTVRAGQVNYSRGTDN